MSCVGEGDKASFLLCIDERIHVGWVGEARLGALRDATQLEVHRLKRENVELKQCRSVR